MVRLYRDIDQSWRRGMILETDDARALIREDDKRGLIHVIISGTGRLQYFELIKVFLQHIHDSFKFLDVTTLFIPPGTKSQDQLRKGINYQALMKRYRKGKSDVMGPDGSEYELSDLLPQLVTIPKETDIQSDAEALAKEAKRHETPNDMDLINTVLKSVDTKINFLGIQVDTQPIYEYVKKKWKSWKTPKEPGMNDPA